MPPPACALYLMSTKNKARSSSNSTSSTGGFVSFADVASPTFGRSAGQAEVSLDPVYTGQDADLSVACKKLFKKDPVTRLKALVEVSALLQDRGAELFLDFISFFVYSYTRIILENQRLILEQLNSILLQLVTINRPGFKPYMRELIGHWWVATCDVFQKSAETAYAAFEKAFPSQELALQNFSSSILHAIRTNLELNLSSLDSSIEHADEHLERIQAMSLSALRRFLTSLSSESNQAVDREGVYSAIFGKLQFWQDFLQSSRPRIRKHAMELLFEVSSHAPSPIKGILDGLAKLVTQAFQETNTPNVSSVFDLMLQFSSRFPIYWSIISIDKQLFPALLTHLKHQPETALPYVLPLFGNLPEQELFENSESIPKICSFVDEIYAMTDPEELRAYAIGIHLTEVCGYLVIRLVSSTNSTNHEENIIRLCDRMIRFFKLLLTSCTSTNVHQDDIQRLGKVFGKLDQVSQNKGVDLQENVWNPIVDLTKELTQHATKSAFIIVDYLTDAFETSMGTSFELSQHTGAYAVLKDLLGHADLALMELAEFHDNLLRAYSVGRWCSYIRTTLRCEEIYNNGKWMRSSELHSPSEPHTLHYFKKVLEYMARTLDIYKFQTNIILNAVLSNDPIALISLLESGIMGTKSLEMESIVHLNRVASSLISQEDTTAKWPFALKVHFLSLLSCFSLNPKCKEFTLDLLSTWRSTHLNICHWTLLTIAMSPTQFPSTLHQSDILDLILSAFFSRSRKKNRSSSGPTWTPIDGRFPRIECWNDLKPRLYRTLGPELFFELLYRICAELYKKLQRSSDDQSTDDEDQQMQHRKIARHICGVLSLNESTPTPISNMEILLKIGIADPIVWSSNAYEVSHLVAVLNCVVELWEGDVRFLWNSFLENTSIFIEFLIRIRSEYSAFDASTTVDNLVDNVYEAFNLMDVRKKLHFLGKIADHFLSKKLDKGEDLLREILSRSLHVDTNQKSKYFFFHFHIQFSLIHF